MACLSCPCSNSPSTAQSGSLSSEVNNNAYVGYFLHQEQQMKNKQMSDIARKQMRTNLLDQVTHKYTKQSQRSAEVVKKVKEHLTAIPGGKSLTEKIDVLKQNLQKVNCDDPQTVLISNAVEVSKRVEERLARMETRLKVEKDNTELKRKVNLVRTKLQKCYFLMQLVPLSKNRTNYFAFVLKCKEQRNREIWSKVEKTQTERQVEVEKNVPRPSSIVRQVEGFKLMVPRPSSLASGPGFKVREETTTWGFSRIFIQLSDEALRRFCRWKVGWSNSKDYLEKRSGARLELRSAGELLIEGATDHAANAKNIIKGYLGNFKHSS